MITPGPEQDLLMRKALKAETLASATDRLLVDRHNWRHWKALRISQSHNSFGNRGIVA
jgi:hypothetical protein